MPEVRVSPEELDADLEKLSRIITKLFNADIDYSSVIDDMRLKYDRVLATWLKTKTMKASIEEDKKSTSIIAQQNMGEFVPDNSKPAR